MEIQLWQYTEFLDEGFRVRADYSGRGMYGRTCFALVGQLSDLMKFVMFLSDLEIMDRSIENVSMDSMGRDMIFYWEDVQVKKEMKSDG